MKQKAFSLIELVITIAILIIAVPLLFLTFSQSLKSNVDIETMIVTVRLAQEKIEDVLSRDFFDMENLDTDLGWQDYEAAGLPSINRFDLSYKYTPKTGLIKG